jgi:hypothetical protein
MWIFVLFRLKKSVVKRKKKVQKRKRMSRPTESKIFRRGMKVDVNDAVISDADDLHNYIQQVPEDVELFLHQHVVGDGACLYRAIASGLLYKETGFNYGQGLWFSPGILNGGAGGCFEENYSPSNFEALTKKQHVSVKREAINSLALNIVTLWVKFYTYLIGFTNVPEENITWDGGVTNVPHVLSITNPGDYFNLSFRYNPKTKSSGFDNNQNDPRTTYVPSLQCVVYFACMLTFLRDSKNRSKLPEWDQLRELVMPLLCLPWNSEPLRASKTPPKKKISFWNPETETLQISNLSVEEAFNGLKWTEYTKSMRQFKVEGGEIETWLFGSILARAYQKNLTSVSRVSIYETVPKGTVPRSGGIVSRTISFQDNRGQRIEIPATDAISVLYDSRTGGQHYDSLLDTDTTGVARITEDNIGEFIQGPKNGRVRMELLPTWLLYSEW